MPIKTVKFETVKLVAQDDNGAVIAGHLAIGKTLNLGVEGSVYYRTRRHENIDTDVYATLAVALKQFGILIQGSIFKISTNPGNSACVCKLVLNCQIKFAFGKTSKLLTRTGKIHAQAIGICQRRLKHGRTNGQNLFQENIKVHRSKYRSGQDDSLPALVPDVSESG